MGFIGLKCPNFGLDKIISKYTYRISAGKIVTLNTFFQKKCYDLNIKESKKRKITMFRGKGNEALKEAAANHRQSLIKSLEHRLEVARAKGDETLIRQLEAEARYLHVK